MSPGPPFLGRSVMTTIFTHGTQFTDMTAWSVPQTEVFAQLRTALDEGADTVLATVVDVEGSAYRRPGAKMVIRPDGDSVGSITAGCLEAEMRSLADEVLAEGSSRVETYDLTGEDGVWGLGTGCNGVITILLDPLDGSYRPAVDAYDTGRSLGLVTVVGGDGRVPVGASASYSPDGGFDVPADSPLPESVLKRLGGRVKPLVSNGGSETLTVGVDGSEIEVFIDGIQSPPELVVFGAGPDVEPVVELATLADLRVTVVSFRGSGVESRNFPQASDVLTTSPRDVAQLREWDDETYAVVMTHNLLDDRLTLSQLLGTAVPYIGILGSRHRFESIREELEAAGCPLTDAERERIYTPVGLDLGGDTPGQIATSIVAEVLAVSNERDPGHLHHRTVPIHGRGDVTDH